MSIAIIGTGNVGSGLATAFVGAGHRVVLAARASDRLEAAATASGASAAASPAAAAALADVARMHARARPERSSIHRKEQSR